MIEEEQTNKPGITPRLFFIRQKPKILLRVYHGDGGGCSTHYQVVLPEEAPF